MTLADAAVLKTPTSSNNIRRRPLFYSLDTSRLLNASIGKHVCCSDIVPLGHLYNAKQLQIEYLKNSWRQFVLFAKTDLRFPLLSNHSQHSQRSQHSHLA